MRQHSNGRRSRNKSRRGNNGPTRMQVFDSNGPDVRIRGTAWQVAEKYAALAKDAASSGDRIMAENYLQHAEHYQRMINAFSDAEIYAEQFGVSAQEAQRIVGQGQQKEASQNKSRQNQNKTEAKSNGNGEEDLGLPESMLKPAPVSDEANA